MIGSDDLLRGRRAFDQRAWAEAYAHLVVADRQGPLGPEDLERLATSTYLTGRYEESTEFWSRAHAAHTERGEPVSAAGCAFWLAFGLLNRGEHAQASGWLARAQRRLDDA